MKGLRILASILLGLLAAFAVLMALASSGKGIYDRTIANAREIQSSFLAAATHIDAQIIATGALPTPQGFETWASAFPSRPHSINGMHLELPPFDAELVKQFGQPPANGYVISYWRGEWMEHYISWTKQSTLVLDRSAFFWFGSQLIQVITMCVIALALAIAAFATWPRKPRPQPLPHAD